MTIAVAVRTDSAVVFATDSKLTARGMAGLNPDGTPNWVDQTYDNATKVVHDRSRRLMALAAGTINVGRTTATDMIASLAFRECANPQEEDDAITELLDHMNAQKHAFWSQTGAPPDEWPGPSLVIATPSRATARPRIWSASMSGGAYQHKEVLTEPNLLLEGSYMEVFALLYGLHLDMVNALGPALNLKVEDLVDVIGKLKALRPVDKLSLPAMPLQDAIDLAVFIASVQIQMDRFLPGHPVCGGPIDVMALRMTPEPEILAYPGKTLHHPHLPR